MAGYVRLSRVWPDGFRARNGRGCEPRGNAGKCFLRAATLGRAEKGISVLMFDESK